MKGIEQDRRRLEQGSDYDTEEESVVEKESEAPEEDEYSESDMLNEDSSEQGTGT